MMVVIAETNLLTLSVPDDGCYYRNQSFDFERTPSSGTLKVKRLVSGITAIIS
jgi:hypothetical protein